MRGPWEYEDPRCKGQDTEMYYPIDQTNMYPEKELVLSICGSCKHKTECAQWGLEHERFGIWGGLTEAHRRRLRKELGIVLPFGEFCA